MDMLRQGLWIGLVGLLVAAYSAAQEPATEPPPSPPAAEEPAAPTPIPSETTQDPPASADPAEEPKAEPIPPPTPPAEPEVPPVAPPAGEPAETPPTTPPVGSTDRQSPPAEHVIYIPYNKLREVFDKEDRGVLIPFAEYKKLWEAMRQLTGSAAKPPVPAILSSIRYEGKVVGERVEWNATLSVDVLAPAWAKLPLRFDGASVAEVTGEARLAATGPNEYQLLFEKGGKQEVSLRLVSAVQKTAEGNRIAFSGPTAGAGALRLTIPEPDLDVELTPKRGVEYVPGDDKSTTIDVVLGAQADLDLRWRGKQETVTDQAISVADTQSLVTVADGVVHTQARIHFRVLRGAVNELEFSLPADERLLDIQAEGLRDWKVESRDGQQVVTVRLFADVKTEITLRVDAERTLPAEPFAVGRIRPGRVQRETGLISITAGEELTVRVTDRQQVTRVAATDGGDPAGNRAPAGDGGGERLTYKFYSGDYVLRVVAEPVAPRIAAQGELFFQLQEARLEGRARFNLDIQRSGVFAARVQFPANAVFDRVECAGMQRYELIGPPEDRVLVVHLANRTTGALSIELFFHVDRAPTAAELVLPLPAPLDVESERGLVALWALDSFEVLQDASKTQGVRPGTVEEIATPPTDLAPRMNLAAVYQYLARPIEVGFTIQQRSTRRFVDGNTLARISEGSVRTTTTLNYDIRFAASDTLELAVPAAVADRVEITGANIKEKRRGEPTEEGWVPWTVVLQTRVLGIQTIEVTHTQPLQLAERTASTAKVEVAVARALNVERETGQVAIYKQPALSLEEESADNLEPIDPRELNSSSWTIDPSDGDLQLAYRYHRQPVALRLLVTKHELQRVVETIVERALVDAVVAEDGKITYRALYNIRSTQRQRLRVVMPSGARFLGVRVAGQNRVPEKDQAADKRPADTYLINVSRPGGVEEAFPLAIVYEQPATNTPLSGALVPWDLPRLLIACPEFAGDVTFQRLFARVWLPQWYTVVGRPAGMTDETESVRALTGSVAATRPQFWEVESWLNHWNSQQAQAVFEFPTVGRAYVFGSLVERPEIAIRYAYVPTMTAVASGVVLAIMLAGLWLSWGGKMTLLLCGWLVAAGVALYAPEAMYRWISAARLGLATGLVVWFGQAIFQEQARRRRQTSSQPDKEAEDEESEEVLVGVGAEGESAESVPPPSPPSKGGDQKGSPSKGGESRRESKGSSKGGKSEKPATGDKSAESDAEGGQA